MQRTFFFISLVASFLLVQPPASGQIQVVDTAWRHVRNADPREWSEFPEVAAQRNLVVRFSSAPNDAEHTLSVRQYDVKLNWKVTLNGKALGTLVPDEKDLLCYLKIPPGVLRPENTVEISCTDAVPDDIMAGRVAVDPRPLNQVLSEAHISIEVVDAETQKPLPSRITITNGEGILQTVSGSTPDRLAVRPGYVYTGSGEALLGLPAGTYNLYAGRGFEYGLDSARVVVKAGDYSTQRFSIRREVSTKGWVSSDTHIHTFTWSRHGDASVADRVLTIAGEGLELPIMTDHNLNIDLSPFAVDENVRQYFTPVTGDEVTTPVGHFNVFPVEKEKPVIDYRAKTWKALSEAMGEAGKEKVIILNHARDVHNGFRPFDPQIHLAGAGMRLDGWELPANAMEVINSGSQQTDQLQLTRDWFGMLNHGYTLTPVGSSDSHDVSRFIVGQARTYIRCNDDDVANLDVKEAVKNFRDGNVLVSFGLLAGIEVNGAYGPGELAPASDQLVVSVKVSGPSWARAEKVSLYANGKKIREEAITDPHAGGLKWEGNWKLTLPAHDVFLVAVAEGPGGWMPYWPIARPYQPVSPDWDPKIFGISGAVWVDGDRNGRRDPAVEYARELVRQWKGDLHALMQALAGYDEAVATQVAAELYKEGADLRGAAITRALRKAAPETREGFDLVMKEVGSR